MFLESANGERAEFDMFEDDAKSRPDDRLAVCFDHRERDPNDPHAPDDSDYIIPGCSYLGHDRDGDPWFSSDTPGGSLDALRARVEAAGLEPMIVSWIRPVAEDEDDGEMVEVPAALLRHLRDQWEEGDIAEPVRHLLAYLEDAEEAAE